MKTFGDFVTSLVIFLAATTSITQGQSQNQCLNASCVAQYYQCIDSSDQYCFFFSNNSFCFSDTSFCDNQFNTCSAAVLRPQAVYYIASNQHVNELFFNGMNWSNGDITGATGNTPVASNSALTDYFINSSGHATYYLGTNQHVYELYWNGSAWSNGDVTAGAGGVLASSDSGLAVIPDGGTSKAVYYVGTNQHVYELYWNGSTWSNGDITAATGNILTTSTSPLTESGSGTGKAVYNLGSNQHINQLQWTGSAWVNHDLSAMTGAPLAASNSKLTTFQDGVTGSIATYYQGANLHVYELYFNHNTGAWTNGDVTAAAGGTPASGTSLSSYTTCNVGHAVYYIGTNQHVYELYWTGSAWTNGDVTAGAGGTTAAGGLTIFTTTDNNHAVYYIGTNQHVYELFWDSISWTNGDLTAATGGPLATNGSSVASFWSD